MTEEVELLPLNKVPPTLLAQVDLSCFDLPEDFAEKIVEESVNDFNFLESLESQESQETLDSLDSQNSLNSEEIENYDETPNFTDNLSQEIFLVQSDDLFDLTLQDIDGKGIMTVFSSAIKYEDENGELQFIDTGFEKIEKVETTSFGIQSSNETEEATLEEVSTMKLMGTILFNRKVHMVKYLL